jgi:hypothetical protein
MSDHRAEARRKVRCPFCGVGLLPRRRRQALEMDRRPFRDAVVVPAQAAANAYPVRHIAVQHDESCPWYTASSGGAP